MNTSRSALKMLKKISRLSILLAMFKLSFNVRLVTYTIFWHSEIRWTVGRYWHIWVWSDVWVTYLSGSCEWLSLSPNTYLVFSLQGNTYWSCRPVAGSGFGGSAFPAKVDLFACFLRETGIFCTYFGKKWTFLCASFEKVDFFACSPHFGKIIEKYDRELCVKGHYDLIIFHSK